MTDEPYYISDQDEYIHPGRYKSTGKSIVVRAGIPVSGSMDTAEARGWAVMLNKAYADGFATGYRKGFEKAESGGVYS